jgi:hypothetical protein
MIELSFADNSWFIFECLNLFAEIQKRTKYNNNFTQLMIRLYKALNNNKYSAILQGFLGVGGNF